MMSDEQTETLPLRAAYAFGIAHGLEQETNAIRDMDIEWDRSYTSSLRRGYIVARFEEHGIFDDFKKAHWLIGNTPAGEAKRRWFLRLKGEYEKFLDGGPESTGETERFDLEHTQEFAMEAHLRDFLARNLDQIEPGLRLYESAESRGIEFPVDGGRVDLLAVDRSGKFVIIELKVSQGRNKALGQLLYYMGWVDQNMGKAPCRGYIIASEITDELTVAVTRVPGISLAEYRMSFSIEAVDGRRSTPQ